MSKDLFFEMRAEQMATMYSETFTKKEATLTGDNLVNDVFEKGEVEPIRVFSNIVRLKQVIDSAEKGFRERLNLNTEQSWNGVKFTPKNGSKKLNYDEDQVYTQLAKKLKDREELLKTAHNSSDIIFDSEGCEVPKVGCTFTKSSITITF
jgi:hypothetical protein